MSRVNVRQTIEIYEEEGKELPPGVNKSVGIESHWNINRWVVLVIDGKRYTVVGSDLTTAVQNAMNTN